MAGETGTKAAYVRLATKSDVPAIKLLIEGLADFEKLSDQCHATESALESSLFRQPPFEGTTVLVLELGPLKSPELLGAEEGLHSSSTELAYEEGSFNKVENSEDAAFVSSQDEKRTVVGFTLFFPNYSTFLAKNGIYIEDIYIREAYRRQGLGSFLLKTVAQQAANRGLGRVEWSVLDWNINAINFYEGMGAIVMPEWRICRLTGDKLQAFAK